jgi:very-long-chain (3R)-3-hydroxyacyl-CoA dehydratase
MLAAWGLTEVMRYSYFALKQVDAVPAWLHWLRYSAFLVLYPVGISSEVAMTLLALFGPAADLAVWYPYALVAVLTSYVPGEWPNIVLGGGCEADLYGWFRIDYPLRPHAEAAEEVPRGWQDRSEEDTIEGVRDGVGSTRQRHWSMADCSALKTSFGRAYRTFIEHASEADR